MRGRALIAGGLALLGLAGSVPRAQAIEVLTGTLKKIAETGTITLGYRESSLPFSYMEGKHPIGYALDLCLDVVDDVGKAIGRPNVTVKYQPVTPESRIEAVASGKVDIECGSTTANAERRKQVAFSPVTYVSATKLLVKRDSPIRSYRDLAGKTVVATAGTTNEGALRALFARLKIPATVVTAREHADSFAMVKEGKADAFGLDDVLLYGLIAAAGPDGAAYTVLPDKLSFEPYGLMFRKDDPEFASLVQGTFQRLAETRELRWVYERWFLRRLPNGERLDVPMSSELRSSFQIIGLDD